METGIVWNGDRNRMETEQYGMGAGMEWRQEHYGTGTMNSHPSNILSTATLVVEVISNF